MIGVAIDLIIAFLDKTTRPWRRLFWFSLHLYFTAWSILLTMVVRVVSSPLWILNAARREKLLEAELQELQLHFEEVSEKKSEVERRLEVTVRDKKRIKESLDQAVGEWEKSIDRLKLLKARVQELESQNVKLRELEAERRKLARMANPAQSNACLGGGDKYYLPSKGGGADEPRVVRIVDDSMIIEGRGVALASSVFSAVLSMLVGLIAWEAEDPCMPLVVALFIVVGMSLSNVFQFFSRLQSKFGFDAVALLSFNWFMLGTLAFPAFPYFAKFFSVAASRFTGL